jgi:hypothetical protein
VKKLLLIAGFVALVATAGAAATRNGSHQSPQAVAIKIKRVYAHVGPGKTTVTCPRGWSAAAGSMDRSIAVTHGQTGSWPSGERRWVFRTEFQSPDRGIVTCIRTRPAVRLSWAVARQQVWSGTRTMLCPGGRTPTGWGYDVRLETGAFGSQGLPPRMQVAVTTLRPLVGGWDIGLRSSTAVGDILIRCVGPKTLGPAQFRITTRRIARSVHLEPLATRQVSQRCGSGWLPLSPGWSSPGADSNEIVAVVRSFVGHSGTAMFSLSNETNYPHELGVYLLCIRNVALASG